MGNFITLSIILTERCNAKCAHCLELDCDFIALKRDMSVEAAIRHVDSISQLSVERDKPFRVAFSGGEPFLRYADLLELISYANRRGATEISVTTNGYWGKSKEGARRKANELIQAGLEIIGFSFTDFHAEFIPVTSVIGAVEAAVEAGLRCAIKTVVTKKSERIWDKLRHLAHLTPNKTFLCQEISYIPDAHRSLRIPCDDWLIEDDLPKERCPAPILTILPDGSTFPCCSQGWNDTLRVGSALETSAAELMRRVDEHEIYEIIHKEGPRYFVPYLDETSAPLSGQGFTSYCHLCSSVCTHPDFEKIRERAVSDWSRKRVGDLFAGLSPLAAS